MREIFETFKRAGKEVFLVGGAVRDLARGIPVQQIDDMDYCTNSRPKDTLRILQDAGFTTYDVGIEFGTVGAVIRGPESEGYPKDCQITTYRSAEFYRRGSRHPNVKFGDTIDQDLRRRDFSINSIAMDGEGTYVDPYDGLGDLQRGVLRVVSDPLETLAEDPLRILRVGRFISKLGFTPSEDLRAAATQRAGCILDISRERWFAEMSKLLRGPHPRKGLEFLQDVRILGIILPEVAGLHGDALWAQTMSLIERVPAQDHFRWSAALYATAQPFVRDSERAALTASGMSERVMKRFKADNHLTSKVAHVLAHSHNPLNFDNTWDDAQTRRLVQRLDPMLEDTLTMARALADSDAPTLESLDVFATRAHALEEAGSLRPDLPSGIGQAIVEGFEVRPGPVIGQGKLYLEACILDGTLQNKRDTGYYLDHLRAHKDAWFTTP